MVAASAISSSGACTRQDMGYSTTESIAPARSPPASLAAAMKLTRLGGLWMDVHETTKDTGGSGARALYNGCVKCIREGFPNVSIRKMILANSNSISKKQAIFEVLVGDQVSDEAR